jgi:hypothetical protein
MDPKLTADAYYRVIFHDRNLLHRKRTYPPGRNYRVRMGRIRDSGIMPAVFEKATISRGAWLRFQIHIAWPAFEDGTPGLRITAVGAP